MNNDDLAFVEPPRCKFCQRPLRAQPDKEVGGFVFFKCDGCGMSNVAPERERGEA